MRHLFIFCFLFFYLSHSLFSQSDKVKPGIDTLRESNFEILAGKKVGLLTNPAGVDSNGKPTVEVLLESDGVNLTALFGPEHGIYGNEQANEPVDDRIDPKTQLPVFSLYGKYRKPTPKMLEHLDVMVIDLQDIGVRSYTYISCMRLVLEACFENEVEVVILDRPNPLGGIKTDGPLMDKELRSYVGAFPIPYVHGLTIGELALIAKKTEGWLEVAKSDRVKSKLTVIPLQNWKRNMTWNATQLKWIPTSPSIPSLSAVLGYAMTGLGSEINGFRHGYGTQYPFRLLSHRDINPRELIKQLQALQIQGVAFSAVTGASKTGKETDGVYVHVTDWNKLRPTELSFHMMRLTCTLEGENPYEKATSNRVSLFNKHTGSIEWWVHLLEKGSESDVEGFLNRWKQEAETFSDWASDFWIYR